MAARRGAGGAFTPLPSGLARRPGRSSAAGPSGTIVSRNRGRGSRGAGGEECGRTAGTGRSHAGGRAPGEPRALGSVRRRPAQKSTVEVKAAGVKLNDKISSFIHYFSCRAQPKKKKKVDVRKEQAQKDRMKKKIKKLEKAAPEMIPIEDFVTPLKYSDSNR
ncbi:unnamed protein product [Bubo scandiacus]